MQKNNSKKQGITLVEILICMGILALIIGIIITTMSRGASNVQKGSFNALAANQAFWIVSVLRSDISKAINDVTFSSSDEGWNGDSEIEVLIEGGKASYSIEQVGNFKKFVRKFTSSGGKSDLKISDDRIQSFGDQYMTKMTVTDKNENGIKYFYVEITMEDPHKSTPGNHEILWTASIYPPLADSINEYWVPTVEVE